MRKDIMISGICALSLIMLTQNAYAQTYEKESASGKVRFQCELEVPENWNGEEIPQFILESVHFVDSEKTYANFVEGKEILEHYNTPASDLYPEENYYVLADPIHPLSKVDSRFYAKRSRQLIFWYSFLLVISIALRIMVLRDSIIYTVLIVGISALAGKWKYRKRVFVL